MKIFIHAHYYLPRTLAGAEKFLHEIALHLHAAGHAVIVAIDEDTSYQHEGIQVITNQRDIGIYYDWADKVITHLLNESAAVTLACEHGKPLYHLLHNNQSARNLPENNFIIYNSEALRNEMKLPQPSIVCRPVIDAAYWHNEIDHYNNEYITLVNCAIEKGGIVLQQLADSMPGQRFMGVKGGYGTQIIQRNTAKNIQFMPQQLDMRVIYNQTKILIMPSEYESWGMVASEAMASGIPVICSDTPGLRENCGDAAVYVPGQSVAGYRVAIDLLNDEGHYALKIKNGLKRNHGNDLDKLLKFIEGEEVKEKREMPTVKEKKIIKRPGRALHNG